MSQLIDQECSQPVHEQERFLCSLDESLRTIVGEDNLDALFDEIPRARRRLAEITKDNGDQSGWDQLIESQLAINHRLDEILAGAIKLLIESRMRSLAEQAERDPLTMLFNRAAFDRRLRNEIERALRYQREVSLAVFDVDYFKSINDRFGHPAGDQTLLVVAETLQSSLRKSDMVFRLGGDEFAAICPETNGNSIVILLERIETNLSEYYDQFLPERKVTMSWGTASFPIDAIESGGLMIIADSRLYDRKKEHHKRIL
ncbi:MAG: GGDEF domain-containing protein [Acidobacteria bacterium]|nr:GGDEF domain-containing protein [Acidobacteriota bacterium]